MQPGELYFLLMAVVLAPSMWINRMAVLVVSTWLVGQAVQICGGNTSLSDMLADAVALVFAMVIAAYSRKPADLLAGLMFAPMMAVNVGDALTWIHPYHAWWAIYWLAMMQVVLVVAGNDWRKLINAAKRFDTWLLTRLDRHFGEHI